MSRSTPSSPYISIIKPGIIMGNIITLCAGYALATRGWQYFQLKLFIATVIGMSLIIACGCVLNNCIDQDIDKLMSRTQKRVMALGQWSLIKALLYACLLGVLGILFFYQLTNTLTLIVALFGLFVYVVVYSLMMKRNSIYGTLVGGIAGAVPPVVGYTAVSGHIDASAVTLFLTLLFWQIPHSYAIAIYRFEDYKAAGIPVLPVKSGFLQTKVYMLIYVILFAFSMISLTYIGNLGLIYGVLTTCMSLYWILKSFQGFKIITATADALWARQIFFISIIQITLFSVLIILFC